MESKLSFSSYNAPYKLASKGINKRLQSSKLSHLPRKTNLGSGKKSLHHAAYYACWTTDGGKVLIFRSFNPVYKNVPDQTVIDVLFINEWIQKIKEINTNSNYGRR